MTPPALVRMFGITNAVVVQDSGRRREWWGRWPPSPLTLALILAAFFSVMTFSTRARNVTECPRELEDFLVGDRLGFFQGGDAALPGLDFTGLEGIDAVLVVDAPPCCR